MNGKLVMAWQGQDGLYYGKFQYWIGAGYQYAFFQIEKDLHDLFNL